MQPDEAKRCFNKLVSFYPSWRKGMSDEQMGEWLRAFLPFVATDVQQAISRHYRDPKYKISPHLGALLALLQGKEREQEYVHAGESWAQDLARKYGEGVSTFEAILRYRRGLWVRYATDANRRCGNLKGAGREQAMRAADGMRSATRSAAVAELVAEKVTYDDAQRYAEVVFAEPEDFRMAINDLRLNGISTVAPDEESSVPAAQLLSVFTSTAA